jgi:hypothetical protein
MISIFKVSKSFFEIEFLIFKLLEHRWTTTKPALGHHQTITGQNWTIDKPPPDHY